MRSKKEILEDYASAKPQIKQNSIVFQSILLELLADIRDEQVSLNKTLSAVLAGLLVPAQQGGKR